MLLSSRRWVRVVPALVAAVQLAPLLVASPVAALAAATAATEAAVAGAALQVEPVELSEAPVVVPETDQSVTVTSDTKPVDLSPLADGEPVLPAEPAVPEKPVEVLITETVEMAAVRGRTVFGDLPVSVGVPAGLDRGGSVRVRPLSAAMAREHSAVGLAFGLDVVGFGLPGRALPELPEVAIEGPEGIDTEPTRGRVPVVLGERSGWKIGIDRLSLLESFDPSLVDRLVIEVRAGCEGTVCRVREVLPSSIDETTGELVADVGLNLLERIGGIPVGRGAHGPGSGGFSKNQIGAFAALMRFQTGDDIFFTVNPSTNGPQGDYSASDPASLLTWQVGASTGSATTSYETTVPPSAGPTPSVGYSYSSGSVDGLTAGENAQGGLLGVGWSTSQPVIHRATRPCSGANPGFVDTNGWFKGNLCFAFSQDDGMAGDSEDGFTLSMNGVSGRLAPASGSGSSGTHPQVANATYQQFVLENGNDWRIWLVTDSTIDKNPGLAGSNGGWNGQWWEITTGDGTLWVLGRDFVFKPSGGSGPVLSRPRVADTAKRTNSTQIVPIARTDAPANCVAHLCDTVIAWHVDQVVDTEGNMAIYQYWRSANWYKSTTAQPFERDRSYHRSVVPISIDYGLTFGTDYDSASSSIIPDVYGANPPRLRVRFDFAWRNTDPTNGSGTWKDVPTDLICNGTAGGATCDDTSPSFFERNSLLHVTTYQGSTMVLRDSFASSWPTTSQMADGSVPKIWLNSIIRRGYIGTDVQMPQVRFYGNFYTNRVRHAGNGATGVAGMWMPRIVQMYTPNQGLVEFSYGQDHGPEFVNNSSNPCAVLSSWVNGNVRRPCDFFPKYHTNDQGETAPILFNKWLIKTVKEDAMIGGSDYELATYSYVSPPDWALASQWGFTNLETGDGGYNLCRYGYGCNIWNEYRGHREVIVTDETGRNQHFQFFTGMADDRTSPSDNRTLAVGNPSHPLVNLTDSTSQIRLNSFNLSGRQLEVLDRDANNTVQYRELSISDVTPVGTSTSWPKAVRPLYSSSYPALIDPAGNESALSGSVTTWYDAYARPYRVRDRGTSGAADDQTTCTQYTPVTATGAWITNAVWKTATVAGDGVDDPFSCSSVPASIHWLSGQTFRYDENPTSNAEATRGRMYISRTFVKRGLTESSWPKETYGYDGNGRVDSIVSSTAGTTSFTYDSWGHVRTTDGPFANDTLTTVIEPAWGNPTSVTDPASGTTTLTYDALGRALTANTPNRAGDTHTQPSYKFTYTFATANTPAKVQTETLRTSAGSFMTTAAFFDGFGRPIQNQVRAINGALESVDRTIYGDVGHARIQIMPVASGNSFGTFWEMPASNRDRSVTDIDDRGDRTTSVYDANTLKLTSTVETRGKLTTTVQAGQTSKQWHDIRGNVTKTRNNAGQDTTVVYNLRDQATLITGPGPNPSVVATDYGANWQTSPVTLTDSSLGTVNYLYDNFGRLTEQTDGDGNNLHIAYGTASVPEAIRRDSTAGPIVSDWMYDPYGRIDSATHNNLLAAGAVDPARVVATDYDYTNRSELDSVTYTIPGLDDQTLNFDYREAGGVESVTYPNGQTSTYSFDHLERQTGLTHNGTQLADLVAYTARGQVDALSYGAPGTQAGFDIDYTYDDWSGTIDTMTATAQGGGIVQNLDFDWAANGNLNSIRDNAPGVAQWQCFTYDTKNQLTVGYTTTAANCAAGANNGGPDPYSVAYQYHANGNIQTATGTGTPNATYGYGAGPAGPHAVTSAGSNSYTYSSGGLMQTRIVNGATSQLNYDVQNRLIGIAGQTNMDALYAADGARVKRVLDDPATSDIESTSYYVGDSYEVVHTPTESTTTTTTQPTTTTTQASTTTTAGGGTKTLTVRAQANWGSPSYDVVIDGTIEGSQALTQGAGWVEHTYTVDAATAIQDLVIDYPVDNGTLGLDWVKLDGVTYQAEDPDVESKGEWTGSSCEPPGNNQSQYAHCVGYWDFGAIPGGSTTTTTQATTTTTQPTTTTTQASTTTTAGGGTKTLTVRAQANWGSPSYDVVIDGTIEGSQTLTQGAGWVEHTYTVDAATAIQDLVIDYPVDNGTLGLDWVKLDGVTYQAEDPDVESRGEWTGSSCEPPGNNQSQYAHCVGYWDFGAIPGGGGGGNLMIGSTTSGIGLPSGPGNNTTAGFRLPTLFFLAPTGYDETIRIHHTIAGHRIGTTTNDTFTAALTDHLGSNTASRTATGETTQQRYTPFGVIRGGVLNQLETDHTFTGQTLDPGTGLMDYNARHYDPQLGRFIMADTILDGLNRYTYVRNSPLRFSDPTGHVCYESGPKKGQCYEGADGEDSSMTSEEEALTVKIPNQPGTNPDGTPQPSENVRFNERFGDNSSDEIVDAWRQTTENAEHSVRVSQLTALLGPGLPELFNFSPSFLACFGAWAGALAATSGEVCASSSGVTFAAGAGLGSGGGIGFEFGSYVSPPTNDGELDLWIAHIGLNHCARANAAVVSSSGCFDSNGQISVTGTVGTEIGQGAAYTSQFTMRVEWPWEWFG